MKDQSIASRIVQHLGKNYIIYTIGDTKNLIRSW